MDNRVLFTGIDTGGTFTDIIAVGEDKLEIFKVPSTPDNPSKAIIGAMKRIDYSHEIIHGTTIATNAVLERKGARVALVTTKGFADVIEIGRQTRTDIYALYPERPTPLVPENLRFEVDERVLSDGTVETSPSDKEIIKLKEIIENEEIDSIAIVFLFSFLEPGHEKKVAELLSDIAPVSTSSKVLPEYREYERTSTTVMDAYIKPLIKNYIQELSDILLEREKTSRFAVMKSDMGLAMGTSLVNLPVDTIFSGLAGGINAAEYSASLIGIDNMISLDIGGTSTDVSSVINGQAILQKGQKIDGLPVSRPAVDVITIGAGGGSLVKYEYGLLKIGPDSAGADPGPISYDRGGTIPTVTDVDLIYGILPTKLAGGVLELNRQKALNKLRQLAEEMELSLEEAIVGIRQVFHENVAGALRAVSTQRGNDPRNFSLLCFGGAGPVHAAELAEMMEMKHAIIPPYPGVWSAMGLLGGDFKYLQSQGIVANMEEVSKTRITSIYNKLIEQTKKQALSDGHNLADAKIQKLMDLRFVGQSYSLEILYHGNLDKAISDFVRSHEDRYGFSAKDEPVELVNLRVIVIIEHESPILPMIPDNKKYNVVSTRQILGLGSVDVIEKQSLGSNSVVLGPAIIEQDDSTIWVPSEWQVEPDKYGFLHLFKQS